MYKRLDESSPSEYKRRLKEDTKRMKERRRDGVGWGVTAPTGWRWLGRKGVEKGLQREKRWEKGRLVRDERGTYRKLLEREGVGQKFKGWM